VAEQLLGVPETCAHRPARPPLGSFMAAPRCAGRDGRDNQRAEPRPEPVLIDTQSNGVVVHGASQAIQAQVTDLLKDGDGADVGDRKDAEGPASVRVRSWLSRRPCAPRIFILTRTRPRPAHLDRAPFGRADEGID
jgi:hypothetical protein